MSDEERYLRNEIQSVIDQWDGTIYGYQLKNMVDNGTDLESVCDFAGIDYED